MGLSSRPKDELLLKFWLTSSCTSESINFNIWEF